MDFITRLNLQDPHDVKTVSGGDVNKTYSLYSGMQRYFLKVQPGQSKDYFDHEIASLKALSQAVRVPKVMKQGEIQGNAYLLMDWVPAGTGNQETLGQKLADLHRVKGKAFGFEMNSDYDNVPKDNTWSSSWGEFFVKQRLEPLMTVAQKKALWLSQRGDHFENLKKTIMADEHVRQVEPTLLHGDLWAGNFMFDNDDEPVFIDPNSFYGDREFDLAVTKVFPGFNDDFYRAYQAAYPLEDGYQDRFKWYEFYYILMHFVRFGDIYAPRLNKLLISF
ncbi:fructosamine-3-kinase [Fructobacillus pseudoficulneus]|uniref:Fructosamine-3-kinase n=1 Tax=Fructobacillus pseudoficulneus TaxID=220714 RepID=A0A3F3H3Q5_9LACO|nr:fructosamine kinase family protein [Fructobacillus pseudoficulneus]GAP02700.1 fructosamine-3-kinase [Fructobacillus pseudoficulneus]SEH39204.1 Fructosamine-3-kinase [Fructobacillus pseudoficulneus]